MNTIAKMLMRGQEGEGCRAEARPTVAQRAYTFLAWRTRASCLLLPQDNCRRTDEMNLDLVHTLGNRFFNQGNASRKV